MELPYNCLGFGRSSYQIDNMRIYLLVYRLLTIFLASPKLSDLCSDDIESSGSRLKQEFEQSEIEHLIIQIATLIRVYDDQIRKLPGIKVENIYNPDVGELYSEFKKRNKEALRLREACNKIIHAKTIKYEIEKKSTIWQSYLKPFIYLYGEKNRKKWKAVLDIKRFCLSIVDRFG